MVGSWVSGVGDVDGGEALSLIEAVKWIVWPLSNGLSRQRW